MLTADSANSHLKPQILQSLRQKKVVASIVPKGCTQYLQLLDTMVFSVFKSHYQTAADEFIDQNGPRHKLKLSAKQQRILCTRLISTAWTRTLKSVNLERAFMDIGYTWVDESPVSIRTLGGFVFDPTTVISSPSSDDDEEDADDISVINVNQHLTLGIKNNNMKQLCIDQFIRKN